jgi:RNA polymerase sigma-70 factor (ECF subfamily)
VIKLKKDATFLEFIRLNIKGGKILANIAENQLIKRLKKNDEKAYEELLDLYGSRLLKTCFLVLKDEKEAEDVAQETFIKLFSQIHLFKGKSRLYTWIYRIGLNLCKDKMKSKKEFILYEDTMESDEGVEEIVLDKIDNKILHKELEGLPHIYKEVLILFYFEDQSIKEISEILEEKEGTIKSRLSRGRIILRDAILKGGEFGG